MIIVKVAVVVDFNYKDLTSVGRLFYEQVM